jgi:YesN/AraC family two-component response regulator
MVVEDDKSAIEVLSLMIPRKVPDVTIYAADNGKQGVELCKEHAPDIVITDINMPGMDGIQMAEEIKSMKADTRVIVLTGYSDKIHLDKFNDIGINDYILKPIEFKKLFTAIEKCMDEIWLERR